MARIKKEREAQSRQVEEIAPEQEAATPDVRDEQLAEDVACCLAEIDEVLAEATDEREKAEAEFRQLKKQQDGLNDIYRSKGHEAYRQAEKGVEDGLRLWQAQYAHLGLSYQWCCGELQMLEDEG